MFPLSETNPLICESGSKVWGPSSDFTSCPGASSCSSASLHLLTCKMGLLGCFKRCHCRLCPPPAPSPPCPTLPQLYKYPNSLKAAEQLPRSSPPGSLLTIAVNRTTEWKQLVCSDLSPCTLRFNESWLGPEPPMGRAQGAAAHVTLRWRTQMTSVRQSLGLCQLWFSSAAHPSSI